MKGDEIYHMAFQSKRIIQDLGLSEVQSLVYTFTIIAKLSQETKREKMHSS